MAAPVNVPNVPGVPAVPFASGYTSPPSLMTEDTYSYIGGNFGPQWGIFLDGAPVVTADTVTAFDFRQEFTISDYPLEQGDFESYDKVRLPFQGRFQFAAGGQINRQAMLSSIAAIIGDTNLYDIVTPDQVYSNVSLLHQDYRRTATAGAGMLLIDVWAEEIRIGSSTGTLSQAPSGASQTDGGVVQPTTPTPNQNNVTGSVGFQ